MWSMNDSHVPDDSQVPVETDSMPMVEDHDEHMVQDKVEDIVETSLTRSVDALTVEAPKVDDAGMVETHQVETPTVKAPRFEDAVKAKVLGCATTMF